MLLHRGLPGRHRVALTFPRPYNLTTWTTMAKPKQDSPPLPSASDFLSTPIDEDAPKVDKRCLCCAVEGLNDDLLAFVRHRQEADAPGATIAPQTWAFFRKRYLRPKYGDKLPATEKGIRNHARRHLKVEIPL